MATLCQRLGQGCKVPLGYSPKAALGVVEFRRSSVRLLLPGLRIENSTAVVFCWNMRQFRQLTAQLQ